ncbi:hypothetical protein ES332_A01G099300v1 [Gossypium tomentosum]|uniref:Uncharacterized protein n=1 Tax=Gossypium tomentosum TaxID=34277 RepID=A0A5D2RQW4_GOSTO|nr:hypothetical protein ES332_A01G099300v1 [Gossypium tomentosum]
MLTLEKKKPFLNPCSFPLDRRHSLFAPSPDFCFAGVAIVSNYNRFHQQVHLSIFLCYCSAWNVLEVLTLPHIFHVPRLANLVNEESISGSQHSLQACSRNVQ